MPASPVPIAAPMPVTPATFVQQHREACTALLDALTAMGRLRHPQYGPVDVADALASALASAAANVGGADALLAGRPGSWEADLVERLISGTVGHAVGWGWIAQWRTAPIELHLDVHRVVYGHALDHGEMSTPYETQVDEIWARYEDRVDDESEAALGAELDDLKARWAAAYVAYGEAFTAAVQAEAARIPGMTVPVTVHVYADVDGGNRDTPGHPDEWAPDGEGHDPLVTTLWTAARRSVPLPTVDASPTHGPTSGPAADGPTGGSLGGGVR